MKFTNALVKGFFGGVVLAAFATAALIYFDRPTMFVNENGQCVSATGPNGPIDCKSISKAYKGKFIIEPAFTPPTK